MRGIFSLLSIVAMAMVLCGGGAVFWLSHSTLQQSKQEAAAALAAGIGHSIAAQMLLFEQTIQQIAAHQDVIMSIESPDFLSRQQIGDKTQGFFPNALKIRLLPANVNSVDETVIPNMGYADLEMVKKTLITPQPAIIQGEGENRHLAMTKPIIKENQVIGVVLASLKFDFIQTTLAQAPMSGNFVEISQANVVLGSNGDVSVKNNSGQSFIIPNTPWRITYWSAAARDFADISMIIGVVIFFTVLAGGALAYGYYQTSILLKKDQNKVLEAVKDLMTGKELGGYQVNLTEMQIIISTLAQFKRILDNKQSRNTEHQEQVKLDDSDMLDLKLASVQTASKTMSRTLKKKK